MPIDDSTAVITGLMNPAAYPVAPDSIERIETHISWVFLTWQHAYKVKKPVKLPFVDFSTLALRRQYCEQELRLNRRFAPQLYQAVIAITKDSAGYHVEGDGDPVEFAVKMRRFPNEARLDRVLARGELTTVHCDALARRLAEWHEQAGRAAASVPFGDPAMICRHASDAVQGLRANAAKLNLSGCVEAVGRWMAAEGERLKEHFIARKQHGFVRECHGDLHLENLVLLDGEVLAFDCLEFRDELRWIDVMADVAFVTMDLTNRGQSSLAHRLTNAYLEAANDVTGLHVLRFYQAYRALVRAEVLAIRLRNASPRSERADTDALKRAANNYLKLAERYTWAPCPVLIITHGVSGSGKTTVTQPLLEELGAVRLRSDVERRRAESAIAVSNSRSEPAARESRYSHAARQAVYDYLRMSAEQILQAGFSAIVDATFLQRAQRASFRELAAELQVPFVILACETSPAQLQTRVHERLAAGRDPSEATPAVVEQQLRECEPLTPDEQRIAITVNTAGPVDIRALLRAIATLTGNAA